MSKTITIQRNSILNGTIRHLPASKSISNRALVLNALAGNTSTIRNLSKANDTQLMSRLITDDEEVLDVEDAGTTMRFLTAYCALSGKSKIITGTERMKQRPIGILVDALRKLGAEIEYLEKEGFPPLKTNGFSAQKTAEVRMRGDVSSQYISALMMVAPTLPLGLKIIFEGRVTSMPYIEMTASLMKQFGVPAEITSTSIIIPHITYTPAHISIESDWSAASYWFAFTALAENATLELPSMTLRSLQGDRVIVDMMELIGVQCEPKGSTLRLIKKDHHNEFSWDFTHCPDLAQTISVVCAAKGIRGVFTGLESLRIKETDRIKALQTELSKINATLNEENEKWILTPGILPNHPIFINTYLDHRMAMAFAPLATMQQITIENPEVVRKSYPTFWEDVLSVGFKAAVTGVN